MQLTSWLGTLNFFDGNYGESVLGFGKDKADVFPSFQRNCVELPRSFVSELRRCCVRYIVVKFGIIHCGSYSCPECLKFRYGFVVVCGWVRWRFACGGLFVVDG